MSDTILDAWDTKKLTRQPLSSQRTGTVRSGYNLRSPVQVPAGTGEGANELACERPGASTDADCSNGLAEGQREAWPERWQRNPTNRQPQRGPRMWKGPPQPVFHTPISSIFSAFSMEVSPELCDWEGLQSGGRYRLQKVERPRATAGLPTLCLCVFPRAAFSNPLRVQGNDLLVCVSEPQAPAYLACGHALN